MPNYTHYVVVSKSHTCPWGMGTLNQGFGSTPKEAWVDAVGRGQNVELFKFKVKDARRSRWWLCMCDKEFFESRGDWGNKGPAGEDPTKDLWDNLDHWSGPSYR